MENCKKQQLREIEAAVEVVRFTIQTADKEWPEIYKAFTDMYKEKFEIEDESKAPFDLTLALLSLGLQSTRNLFTTEQAQRLSKYVFDVINTDEHGDYAKRELEQYQKAFERFKETKNYPHDEVAARLLHRLLGKNIENITVKFGEKKTNVLSPLVVSTLSGLLIHLLAPNPWKIIHDQYELIENDFSMEEVKNETQNLKKQTMSNGLEVNSRIDPESITDLIDKIDIYLEEMRDKNDKVDIPKKLSNYIWGYFRDINPDKEKLKILALILCDHTYRYAARVMLTDDYTQIYFASVITELWDAIQSRGVDTFYILDNELREDRFMLTIQLFALSGIAVVTPYMVKGSYHKYMTPEEQAKWALSFEREDFDPKKFTFTMDSSEDLRYVEVMNLIEKYMKHLRNIVYIEKDATVNYLEEVKNIARNSKYMSIFRNKAPSDPHVTTLSELDRNIAKQIKD